MKRSRNDDWIPGGCLSCIGAGVILVLLAGLVGRMDHEEAQRQETECREMLALWEETGGERGWPSCGR